MKFFNVGLICVLLAIPAGAQTKKVTKKPVEVASTTTPPATPKTTDAPVQAPATNPPTTAKDAPKPRVIPPELTQGLEDVRALSRAIAKIKTDNGIDKLENQLNTQSQSLIELATKDGFQYNAQTGGFVETPPAVPAPEKK